MRHQSKWFLFVLCNVLGCHCMLHQSRKEKCDQPWPPLDCPGSELHANNCPGVLRSCLEKDTKYYSPGNRGIWRLDNLNSHFQCQRACYENAKCCFFTYDYLRKKCSLGSTLYSKKVKRKQWASYSGPKTCDSDIMTLVGCFDSSTQSKEGQLPGPKISTGSGQLARKEGISLAEEPAFFKKPRSEWPFPSNARAPNELKRHFGKNYPLKGQLSRFDKRPYGPWQSKQVGPFQYFPFEGKGVGQGYYSEGRLPQGGKRDRDKSPNEIKGYFGKSSPSKGRFDKGPHDPWQSKQPIQLKGKGADHGYYSDEQLARGWNADRDIGDFDPKAVDQHVGLLKDRKQRLARQEDPSKDTPFQKPRNELQSSPNDDKNTDDDKRTSDGKGDSWKGRPHKSSEESGESLENGSDLPNTPSKFKQIPQSVLDSLPDFKKEQERRERLKKLTAEQNFLKRPQSKWSFSPYGDPDGGNKELGKLGYSEDLLKIPSQRKPGNLKEFNIFKRPQSKWLFSANGDSDRENERLGKPGYSEDLLKIPNQGKADYLKGHNNLKRPQSRWPYSAYGDSDRENEGLGKPGYSEELLKIPNQRKPGNHKEHNNFKRPQSRGPFSTNGDSDREKERLGKPGYSEELLKVPNQRKSGFLEELSNFKRPRTKWSFPPYGDSDREKRPGHSGLLKIPKQRRPGNLNQWWQHGAKDDSCEKHPKEHLKRPPNLNLHWKEREPDTHGRKVYENRPGRLQSLLDVKGRISRKEALSRLGKEHNLFRKPQDDKSFYPNTDLDTEKGWNKADHSKEDSYERHINEDDKEGGEGRKENSDETSRNLPQSVLGSMPDIKRKLARRERLSKLSGQYTFFKKPRSEWRFPAYFHYNLWGY